MWTRAGLKEQAKANLKMYYWNGVLVIFLAGLIGGVLSLLGSMAGMLIPAVGSLLVTIFATNIIAAGIVRYFTISELNGNDAGVGELFGCFSNGYGRIALVMFLRSLFTGLWMLLLIVPGIIKSYEYYMVPYLVAEYPEMDRKEIFALSKQMMTGYKFDTFVLELSFIGWFLLGVLACGIGTLFVTPYYEATKAQLYLHLKEERLGIVRSGNGGAAVNNTMNNNGIASDVGQTMSLGMNTGKQGFLVGIQGEFAGANIPLDNGDLVIGTDASQCNLVIQGQQISPVHLRVEYRGGMFNVIDYSSTGTFNLQGGQLPKNQSVSLASGTYLQLGTGGDIFSLECR